MSEKEYKFKEVWETLSAIDVNEHTKEKQGLTYLSWAWAWGIMMENYPEFEFSFFETENNLPYVSLPDGSAEVRCTVTIGNLSRTQSLPLSSGFKPIINPNAFQINTAKQRCLTKCFAIFGLGHYIYAGEDIVIDTKENKNQTEQKDTVIEDIDMEVEETKVESDNTVEYTNEELVIWKDETVGWLGQAETDEELVKFYNNNKPKFEGLKNYHKGMYEDLLNNLKKRKETLLGEQKQKESDDKKGDKDNG